MEKIQATWRRSAPDGGPCVGGDCDTVYPQTVRNGRPGRIAILETITGGELAHLEHQPAAHESAVFIPDDVREHLGG